MSAAIRKAGRPVVLSICEWGTDKPWLWGPSVGHLWRTTGDISNCFDCLEDHGSWRSLGAMQILDMQDTLRAYAGPGHWNDPDMLEIGNGKMTPAEDRSHFSMWAMLCAPLIAGNDLRTMSRETREVLANKEVIAINQDSLGIQALKYIMKDSVQTWIKPLKNGDWSVGFLNRSVSSKMININWGKMVVTDTVAKRTLNTNNANYSLLDLWLKKDRGTTKDPLKVTIPAHDILLLRLRK